MSNYLLTIRKNKGKIILQSLIIISFIFYLLNVFNKVTGYIHLPPLSETQWSWDWNTQLIPFFFISDLINHYIDSGLGWFFWNAVKLSFYNLLLLLPLGVYLSIFKINSISRAAIIIFAVSFVIETMQIIFSYFGLIFPRSFNIDDLILNTMGGVLGYLIFELIKKIYIIISHKKKRR